jgi:1,4-dihydroxy-2-naphthoate octaprenyltransferase
MMPMGPGQIKIKAFILICIALIAFGDLAFSGGSTRGYLSLVIGLVCGLLGALYLKGEEKPPKKRK